MKMIWFLLPLLSACSSPAPPVSKALPQEKADSLFPNPPEPPLSKADTPPTAAKRVQETAPAPEPKAEEPSGEVLLDTVFAGKKGELRVSAYTREIDGHFDDQALFLEAGPVQDSIHIWDMHPDELLFTDLDGDQQPEVWILFSMGNAGFTELMGWEYSPQAWRERKQTPALRKLHRGFSASISLAGEELFIKDYSNSLSLWSLDEAREKGEKIYVLSLYCDLVNNQLDLLRADSVVWGEE